MRSTIAKLLRKTADRLAPTPAPLAVTYTGPALSNVEAEDVWLASTKGFRFQGRPSGL